MHKMAKNTPYLTKVSRGELRSDQFLCPEKSKMAKKLPNNLHGRAFPRIVTFSLTKKVYQ